MNQIMSDWLNIYLDILIVKSLLKANYYKRIIFNVREYISFRENRFPSFVALDKELSSYMVDHSHVHVG